MHPPYRDHIPCKPGHIPHGHKRAGEAAQNPAQDPGAGLNFWYTDPYGTGSVFVFSYRLKMHIFLLHMESLLDLVGSLPLKPQHIEA